jgi:hypothetical protein
VPAFKRILDTDPLGPRASELAGPTSVALAFLNLMPLASLGLPIPRDDFKDMLKLLYLVPAQGLPDACKCSRTPAFTSEHSQICRMGGYIMDRHNAVRDLLFEACHKVGRTEIEPGLRPVLPGEEYRLKSANTDPEARSDLRVDALFGGLQPTFIDVRVTYRDSATHKGLLVQQVVLAEEQAKMREYKERVQREGGDFVPFVTTTTGILGKQAHTLLRHLAYKTSTASGEPLSSTLTMFKVHLSVTLARSAVRCLRGSRDTRAPTTHFRAHSPMYMAWASGAAW